MLVWLYRKGPAHYTPARWALVVSCVIALACYLLLPTAPPRMLSGYTDIMSLHAADGWWSTDASAPKGMGGLTNELAAFPSLHAGWALWVALVVRRTTRNYWARGLAWPHALITAIVVIGTGNHWILDVAAGWALVIVAMWLVDPWFDDSRQDGQGAPDRVPPRASPAPRWPRRCRVDRRRGPRRPSPCSSRVEPMSSERLPCEAWADESVRRRYGC